jgi:diaminopimelate decarboxylase
VEWVGVDTGFNHLVRPSKYGAYHHILNASNGTDGSLRTTWDETSRRDDVVVAGNLCESSDIFTRSEGRPVARALEPTRIGDLLAFCDAGAYGFSMGSHYNARPLPPEILVEDGEARVIRSRQTFDDFIRGME